MRILIRTSKWAIWSRRLGSFALPLAIIPVFMHRERMIPSDTFHVIEALAIACAIAALVLGLGAYLRLWFTGDRGWGKATLGILFSLVCLAPALYGASLALRYPMVVDVSTDPTNPPAIMSQVVLPARALETEIAVIAAFPNARARAYPIDAQQMFDIVLSLVTEQGWDVRQRSRPQTPLETGTINAIVTTWLGWRDEVAFRIAGDVEGSTVDMRSVSLQGRHDLGTNGQRVEGFMIALDDAVTRLLRDTPVALPEQETEVDPSIEVETEPAG
ncbi:DUF1499 domain-containing protein [Arsenicitalea aurantiaca]|nr:DUF1499 domain-containing protein [Arsenicitalea aurantiaca]